MLYPEVFDGQSLNLFGEFQDSGYSLAFNWL